MKMQRVDLINGLLDLGVRAIGEVDGAVLLPLADLEDVRRVDQPLLAFVPSSGDSSHFELRASGH